ncbi:MAG: hypothetical protein GXY83_25180 [Rhodopirellula sp.]|nr:hypothetical protein [Rhodopirellula sp.]
MATLFGCTSSPWSATRPDLDVSDPKAAAAETSPTEASPQGVSATPSPITSPDPHALQDVMAQLQQMGDLEPAVRDRLLADLEQTDPRLWPGVIRQFRATLAYRRQSGSLRQNPEAALASSPQVANSAMAITPSPSAAAGKVTNGATQEGNTPEPVANPQPTPTSADVVESGESGGREPTETDRREQSQRTSEETRPVERASFTDGGSDNWQTDLERATRALERNVVASPRSADEVAQHARLRMLYLLAGRREDALRPIPSAGPSIQDFWSKELYGLAAWLDTQRIEDSTLRAAEAKLHLTEAISRLGEQSPLVVRNLAFVTDIQSFGSYKKFSEYQFAPGQEVLLYAEVDNFSTESTSKGYRTSLRFGYQIFDSRGQRVADHEFTANEDCLNIRRDFFIGYHFHIPTRIYDGKHTLQLTVEDLQSQKIGQSSIEFAVKEQGR